jgi:acyl transferase domain-containing protein
MNSNQGTIDRQDVMRRALVELKDLRAKLDAAERAKIEPIAIVGIGCRFPGGANDPASFWQLLLDGRDAIVRVPEDRWEADAYYDPNPDAPGKTYTCQGGFLDGVDAFDSQFFDIPPREAETMDPQHRLLLEVAWEALENAGLAPEKLAGSQTGVFVGITSNDYAQLCVKLGHLDSIDAYVSTGNAFNFATGRLSFVLGLRGPNLAIDTACSSSLVAVHLACQSLRQGECQLALAGGVNLMLTPEVTIALSKARMLAVDGRCKTFDAAADGYGRGEGCGVVVLARLSTALANGNPVLAIIRGSAVNQNGSGSGITVPSAQAQQSLIREALTNARVAPEQVNYVEAHGTGTALGDPIEVRALAAVLAPSRSADRPLVVGAVKTNIGHLEAAAGIASLIKVVLALQHRTIPPHLHLTQPNPYIPWADLPIVIPTQCMSWPGDTDRRIAGVSSFGASGTNAHVVLEEAPERKAPPNESARPTHLLALSAKSAQALTHVAERFADYLATNSAASLPNVCFSANTGRSHFPHRLAVLADSSEHLRERLHDFVLGKESAGVTSRHTRSTSRPKVAFLFPGQGAQYVGMGRELDRSQPAFHAALDECAALLDPVLPLPLRAVLDPPAGAASPLDQTAYTQPALFAVEYALATLWRSWGVRPAALLGHSVGEYVAACLAGVFSLADALTLVAARGRLMQARGRAGAMAAVFASAGEVERLLETGVVIAAFNGPAETVIAGEAEAVEGVLARAAGVGVRTRRLAGNLAFHSALLEPMVEEFAAVAAGVRYEPPRVTLLANLTGRVAGGEIATADYWVKQVRAPVRFWAGLEELWRQGLRVYLEVGPRPILVGLGRRGVASEEGTWLASLRPGRGEWEQVLESAGGLYTRGVAIDWAGVDSGNHCQRVVLPTYPFQRQRYWIPTTLASSWNTFARTRGIGRGVDNGTRDHPLLGQRLSSPLREIQYESRLSAARVPLIGEHRVYGRCVVPGVVYLEMALAAVEELSTEENDDIVLEDFSLTQPLVLDRSDERTVQLVLTPGEAGATSFQIFSQVGEHADEVVAWRQHVSGRVGRQPTGQLPPARDPVSFDELKARCSEKISGAEFYDSIWNKNFELGPSFRCIDMLWRKDGEALGLMRVPDTDRPGDNRATVRPELLILDASVQLLMAALPRARRESAADVYVGTGHEFARVVRLLPTGPLWCRAVLHDTDEGPETIVGSLTLFDETGRIVAEVARVRFRRVTGDMLERVARLARSDSRARHGSLSRSRLLAAEPGERQRLLEAYLIEEVARVLGASSSQLDPNEPLIAQIDSLMVVELKTRIESDIEVSVPASTLLADSSLAELAAVLLNEVVVGMSPPSPSADDAVTHMLVALEQLSEDDARSMLASGDAALLSGNRIVMGSDE